MKSVNSKYLQILLEALIPLLGYFFWGWNLYFILLFYFLDLFADEVMMHLKSRKIIQFQQEESQKAWWINGIKSTALSVLVIALSHVALILIYDEIDFTNEIHAFWTYEELGVQQGYVLFPLVLFAAYQQHKLKFLMSGKFRAVRLSGIWNEHFIAHLLLSAFALIVIGISVFLVFPEVVYVIGLVSVISFYKALFSKP